MLDAEMPAETDNTIRYYLRTIRRQKWTIACVTLVGAAAALGMTRLQTPIYQAQAQILLEPSQSESALAGVSQVVPANIPDEIQRLQSASVVAAVRAKLGSAPAMSASSLTGTDVMVVSVKSSSAAYAARAANTYAQAYLSVRQSQAQSATSATLATLENQLKTVQNQIRAAGGSPTATGGAGQAGANPQVAALTQEETTLNTQIDSLQLASALNSGGAQIIQPAAVPSSPVSPKPIRDGALGFGGGLVLGLGLAFLREQLDETMSNKDDLAAAQGNLPVLGVIPAFPSGRRAKAITGVVTATHPHGVISEAYRQVRTALQFLTLERPAQLIQVTSPRTSEGKSTLIANLAVALAQSGQRVIAVDCDLRRPRLHDIFEVDPDVGFTTVLLGEVDLASALKPVPGVENLQVLASGKRPPNPAELLGSRQVGELLETLRGQADVIVIDSPPIIPVTDAVVLSTRMDATVLVAMAEVTPRRDFGRALELLSQVGAPLVGTVLNKVSADADYGYRYGYAYAYGPPTEPATPARS